jgi:hypothetical protein
MLGAHRHVAAPPELFLLRYADSDSWRDAPSEILLDASTRILMETLGVGRAKDDVRTLSLDHALP